MPNLNSVMLMGNLTRDPELRFTPNQTSVCQIGLAINRKWKDPNGEQKEEVTFIDCEAWGKTGEAINQYLRKGRPIFIEGRLKLDQWQDKDGGNNRSKLKVVVESFQFIDSKPGGGNGEEGQPRQQAQRPAVQSQRAASAPPATAVRQPAAPAQAELIPADGDVPF